MTKNYLLVGAHSQMAQATAARLKEHTLHLFSRTPLSLPNGQDYSVDSTDLNVPLPSLETPLDGLVYFPGTINLKPFGQLTKDDFQHDWHINCLGAVRTIQKYLPLLSEGSSIVLISSVAVSQGMAYHTSIASAKGALEGFGRALAAELAPRIRVNMIAPSLTDTPMATSLLNSETKKEHASQRHPLQKVGTPSDHAAAICYLLSDESSWVTGQVLHVDGGFSTLKLI
ncbi:MAG: hypothetical protein S4CHLAM2_18610 [Chlamydiales bacterium]|nr:hypothetical protein [Chlamydiales bacterium]